MERKNAWEKYPEGKREEVFAFAEGYRKFISDCKTEREFQIANNMLTGACGYGIKTLIERIKELDEDPEHSWRWENDF